MIKRLGIRGAKTKDVPLEDILAAHRSRFRIRLIPTLPIMLLVGMILVAIFANFLTTYDPREASLVDSLEEPSIAGGDSDHLLGTDFFGRDILSRLIHGTRVVLAVVGVVLALSTSSGAILGIVAGYRGGIVDSVIMRAVDITVSLPPILFAIVIAVTFAPSFTNVVVVITIFYWALIARQVRAEVLALREQDYVTFARTAGVSDVRIMWEHILPNVTPTLLVLGTFNVGNVILFEASLSFLGVGIPPPSPSWGVMVKDGKDVIATAWWVSVFPGLAILVMILAMNNLGDWMRDRFDPRLQHL